MGGHQPAARPQPVHESIAQINAAAARINQIAADMIARNEQAQRRRPWLLVWQTVEFPLAVALGFAMCAGLTYLLGTSGMDLPWTP